MCGIAGVLRIHEPGADPPPIEDAIPEHWLDILDASIKHRGPDGQGRWRARFGPDYAPTIDIAFVHRRLSIIDPDTGAQPIVQGGAALMFGPTSPNHAPPSGPQDYRTVQRHVCPACEAKGAGLSAVVFNGCIYNHRQLRRELEAAGHVFETDHCDSEVILHAWREWSEHLAPRGRGDHDISGAPFRERLEGMYACAIWSPECLGDRHSTEPFLARDPTGEKPLYATTPHIGLTFFSSTVPGLEELTNATARDPLPLSTRRISHWARFGYGTFVRKPIRLVEPPSFAWNSTARDLWYAGCIKNGQALDTDVDAAVEQAIRQAVHARLDADQPLGCFLSGGVDSSLVAAFARERMPDLLTFTVRMPDPRYDESAHAQRAADHLGTTHHTLDVEPHPADDLCAMIAQLGLPFGDSSLLPATWVSRAARELVPVALGGDAGDELFAGYERYKAADVLGRRRSILRRIPPELLPDRHPKSATSKLHRLARAARGLHMFDLNVIFQTHDLDALCGPRLTRDWEWEISARQLRRIDLTNYLPDDLLRKADTASMSVGLELRAPFLDRRLIELVCTRLTIEQLMPGGEPKGLLKRIARKHLPASIVDRPKMGFAIPIGDWFRTDYGNMRQLLHDHLESADPFPNLPIDINMDFVRRMLREHDAAGETSVNPWHGRDHSQRLYMLLVLSIWAKWLDSLG